MTLTLHKEWSFLLRISFVNVNKSEVSIGFVHIDQGSSHWLQKSLMVNLIFSKYILKISSSHFFNLCFYYIVLVTVFWFSFVLRIICYKTKKWQFFKAQIKFLMLFQLLMQQYEQYCHFILEILISGAFFKVGIMLVLSKVKTDNGFF